MVVVVVLAVPVAATVAAAAAAAAVVVVGFGDWSLGFLLVFLSAYGLEFGV